MDGFISLISFQHLAPRKCGHQQAITNCLESQTTGSLTQLTNDHLFWRFLWLFCCASPPHLISIPGAQNQKWQTYYINLKEILSAVFILDEPSAFYAEELFEATEGLGTNDEKLQRIFVLRAEVVGWVFSLKSAQVDLRSIDHVYKNQFGKHLDKLVKEETGGHYRSTLLGLIPQAHHGHHGRSRWDKDRRSSPWWCDPSAANNMNNVTFWRLSTFDNKAISQQDVHFIF